MYKNIKSYIFTSDHNKRVTLINDSGCVVNYAPVIKTRKINEAVLRNMNASLFNRYSKGVRRYECGLE